MGGYYWTLRASAGYKYDPDQPRIPAGQPGGGRWTATGSWTLHERSSLTPEEFKERTNLSMQDLKDVFTLPGFDAEVELEEYRNMYGQTEVSITVKWTHPDGRVVGKCHRGFYLDQKQCINDSLSIHPDFRDRDLAHSLYRRQIEMLRNRGYESVLLFADSSIGKYAWARQGFDYDPNSMDSAKGATRRMRVWLVSRGINPDSVMPSEPFKTAREVAEFDPGLTFTGADIANKDVPKDMKMHLGKAFMLDQSLVAHGPWDGILWLNQ